MSKFCYTKEEAACSKSDGRYGTPQEKISHHNHKVYIQEGTRTAFRGQKAHQSISREVVELCEVIQTNGKLRSGDGKQKGILFGELFNIYNSISNKVVGLLIRARKYKLVEFEGETLFQGRDDQTPVYLLRTMEEVKQVFKSGEDPTNFSWGAIGKQLF